MLDLGILRENMRVELFVRNLFDEKGWAGAATGCGLYRSG